MVDFTSDREELAEAARALDTLSRIIHARNIRAGWWKFDENGNKIERNMGELLCLVHSEISEAMEGDRKGLQDDKLPQYPMLIVELIDALVREFDILGNECEKAGLSVADVFMAKIDYNATRADHKPENRALEGGKKY
jgi:hypothetical protein